MIFEQMGFVCLVWFYIFIEMMMRRGFAKTDFFKEDDRTFIFLYTLLALVIYFLLYHNIFHKCFQLELAASRLTATHTPLDQ